MKNFMSKSFLKKALLTLGLAFGIAVPSYAGVYINWRNNHLYENSEVLDIVTNVVADIESNIIAEAKIDNWISGVDWHVITRDTIGRAALVSTANFIVKNYSDKKITPKEIAYIIITHVASGFITTAAQEFGQNYLRYKGVPEQPAKYIAFGASYITLSAFTTWAIPAIERAIVKEELKNSRGLKSVWEPSFYGPTFKQTVEKNLGGYYRDIVGSYDLSYSSEGELQDENNVQFRYGLTFSRYSARAHNIEACVHYNRGNLHDYCTNYKYSGK